jgi:hypothetical protein
MKHITLLLLMAFSLVFSGSLYGQKSYRNGYIINNNGDTLNGLVQFESSQNSKSKCVFKRFDIASEVTYMPEDILAWGLRGSRHFETKKVNGEKHFYECLVKGNLSLYSFGNKLFLEKGDDYFIELKKGSSTYNASDGQHEFDNYTHILQKLTSDIDGFDVPPSIPLAKDDIQQFLVNYNQQTKGNLIVYKSIEEQPDAYNFIFTEYKPNRYGLYSSFNLNPSSIEIVNRNYPENSSANYLYENFSLGAFFNTTISLEKNIFLQAEVLFTKRTNYFYLQAERIVSPKEMHHIDLYSSMSFLKLPISLQYELPLKKLKPYASAGIVLNFLLSTNNTGFLEVERTSEILTWDLDSRYYIHNRNLLSFFGGLGLKQKIHNNLFLIFESRLELINSEPKSQQGISGSNVEYFEFTYWNSPEVTLSHKAPIVSFMIGIGF